jgi:hypothetical protein
MGRVIRLGFAANRARAACGEPRPLHGKPRMGNGCMPVKRKNLSITPKNSIMILKILAHPLTQLFSFCIVLVGSTSFGGPYVYFLYHGVQELLAYAIFGWMGIALTLSALMAGGWGMAVLQFIGLCVMVVSLVVFVLSGEHFMNIWLWRQIVPLSTLGLFGLVAGIVVRKFIKAGGI